MLNVPYFEQINEFACGAAIMVMVHQYLRPESPSPPSQKWIYDKLNKQAAHNAANRKVNTDDIISYVMNRGQHAGWGRIELDPQRRLEQLEYFLCHERIPLIACQRYTNEDRQTGHFRILLAATRDEVILHDPCPKTGGAAQRWPMEKLIEYWKFTGSDVTGGVALWIADRPLDSPLIPRVPNFWHNAYREQQTKSPRR